MDLVLLPVSNPFFTPWPEDFFFFGKIINSPPHLHCKPPWPMRSFQICLMVPASPTSSLSFPYTSCQTPFHNPTLYPNEILITSESIPESLIHFWPSHMLFPPPRIPARVPPTWVLAFNLLQEAFLVLFPYCPLHPTSHGRRQAALLLLSATCLCSGTWHTKPQLF